MLTYNPDKEPTNSSERKQTHSHVKKKKKKQNKKRTNVSSKLVGYQSMYPSISLCNYHDHIIIKPRILGGLLKNRCQQFLSNEYPAWTIHKKLGEVHVHVHRQLKHMHIHSCLPESIQFSNSLST